MMEFDGEMMDFDTITLPMEDGTEQEYAILDDFDLEEKKYLVVSKVEGDKIDIELFFFAYTEDGDDLIIEDIEDDDEFEKVVAFYETLLDAEVEDEEE